MNDDLRNIVQHVSWIAPLFLGYTARYGPDYMPVPVFWFIAIAGWVAVIISWKKPGEMGQFVAFGTAPLALAVFLLAGPGPLDLGAKVIFGWGLLPFVGWLIAAGDRGSPNVDGRGWDDGDGGGGL